MSEDRVNLTIEGRQITAPKGALIVDAAKRAGVEIPVFCYHPKMKPVGMCRMCLVEIGRPQRDRESGELILDQQGQPLIQFSGKLETACTTPVGEGWVVRGTNSELAQRGRREIVEQLLTSHPLDCPICDKGGECPLQNLTMDYGPGKSRFLYEDKIDLAKKVPLGDLIVLDRERCIQCARCTRFQDEIVDDPVIGFYQRGRRLEIVTFSDPGFDSYFSGNTTDICPVGALTTTDFRFEARPWELRGSASICTHCPVGCNTTLQIRRQPNAQGKITIQRVLPRQNEHVNEIWICDKGRFAHHYAGSEERITRPLVRKGEQLVEVSWEEALTRAAEGLGAARGAVLGLAGDRASNEDLFNFRRLLEGLGGRAGFVAAMGGGDAVQGRGVGTGIELSQLGAGDALLVIASDLHEEAPIWWLRVKQAAERGATLVVANARPTRLDDFASQHLRYAYGEAPHTALGLLSAAGERGDLTEYVDADIRNAAQALTEAQKLVVFFGGEGLTFQGSRALALACANLIQSLEVEGGLIPVWPGGNTQGLWDIGLDPLPQDGPDLAGQLEAARAVMLMAADPAGDDPALAEALDAVPFLVVQELFLTASAKLADVVFPAQSFIEREGSYTSGERQVQRTYPVTPVRGEARPDWKIIAQLGRPLDVELEDAGAAAVLAQIAEAIPDYAGLSYQRLAQVESQWPPVGEKDLYFGGTSTKNFQGLGARLAPAAEKEGGYDPGWEAPPNGFKGDGLLLVPVEALYDHGITVRSSEILKPRLVRLELALNPQDAAQLELEDGATAEVRWNGRLERLPVRIDHDVPQGVALAPRSSGLAISKPERVDVGPAA